MSLPQRPCAVFIRVREQCNARCQMCDFWQHPDGPGLSFEALSHLVREIRDLGVSEVGLTGGEPFYYPQLDRLLDTLAGESTAPKIAIITNGSRRDATARRILENPLLARLHVSLDALDDAGMLAVRGRKGWYTGILEFVRLARELRPDLRIVVNAILNRHNRHQLPAYYRHHPFDAVNFLNLKGSFEMALGPQEVEAVAAELGELLRDDEELRRHLYVPWQDGPVMAETASSSRHIWGGEALQVPCHVTSMMAYIDHRGEVYPCNCLPHGNRVDSLGNACQSGFAAVWSGAAATAFRRLCLSSDWRTCVSCDPANRLFNLALAQPSRTGASQGAPHDERFRADLRAGTARA